MAKLEGQSALVIGATGGVGGEATRVLLKRGWSVRALHRQPEAAARTARLPGVEWIKGDAMIEADVVAAARGAAPEVESPRRPSDPPSERAAAPIKAHHRSATDQRHWS